MFRLKVIIVALYLSNVSVVFDLPNEDSQERVVWKMWSNK